MKVNIDLILREVCKYYDLTPHQLFKKTRKEVILKPRQMFYYQCCKYTNLSLEEIGSFAKVYSNRSQDHSTVIHARNTIQNYIDTKYKETVLDVKVISMNAKREYVKNNAKKLDMAIIEGYYAAIRNCDMVQYIEVKEFDEITFEKVAV